MAMAPQLKMKWSKKLLEINLFPVVVHLLEHLHELAVKELQPLAALRVVIVIIVRINALVICSKRRLLRKQKTSTISNIQIFT